MKQKPIFTADELREIAQAYFTLTTREMIESEILLIRAGLDLALPPILDAALESIQYAASIREVLETRTTFDNEQKGFLDYMWAKSSLQDTTEHAYDVCKRLGSGIEVRLVDDLEHPVYQMQLLTGCILYKFASLSTETIKKLRAILHFVSTNNPESSLHIILLLILYKAGDLQAKKVVSQRVRESGLLEERLLENSFLLVLLDVARGNNS